METLMDTRGSEPARSYLNPPATESLCEAWFLGTTWNDALVDGFFERIKKSFPHQIDDEPAHIKALADEHDLMTENQFPRKVFLSDDGESIIQIEKDLYIFNQLNPRRVFSEWGESALRWLSVYMELASPQNVNRVCVRHMNRFEIPGTTVTLEDYFNVYPMIPQGLGESHHEFLTRAVVPMRDRGHTLEFSFSSRGKEGLTPERQVFVLDLYARSFVGVGLDMVEIRRNVAIAHKNIVKAFEGTITNRLRDLLGRKG